MHGQSVVLRAEKGKLRLRLDGAEGDNPDQPAQELEYDLETQSRPEEPAATASVEPRSNQQSVPGGCPFSVMVAAYLLNVDWSLCRSAAKLYARLVDESEELGLTKVMTMRGIALATFGCLFATACRSTKTVPVYYNIGVVQRDVTTANPAPSGGSSAGWR